MKSKYADRVSVFFVGIEGLERARVQIDLGDVAVDQVELVGRLLVELPAQKGLEQVVRDSVMPRGSAQSCGCAPRRIIFQ